MALGAAKRNVLGRLLMSDAVLAVARDYGTVQALLIVWQESVCLNLAISRRNTIGATAVGDG